MIAVLFTIDYILLVISVMLIDKDRTKNHKKIIKS